MLTRNVVDHSIWILLDPSLPHFRVVLPQLILLFQTACSCGSLLKFLKLPGSELPGILCPWSGSYPVGGGVGKAQLFRLEQFEVQLSPQSPPSGSG